MPPYAATYVFGFEGIKIRRKMFNFNSNARAIICGRVCVLRCLSSPRAAQREAINAALTSIYAMLMTDYLPIQASATSIIVSKFNVRFCAQENAAFKPQNSKKFAIFQCRRFLTETFIQRKILIQSQFFRTMQFSRHCV